jgi:hypothetical protein
LPQIRGSEALATPRRKEFHAESRYPRVGGYRLGIGARIKQPPNPAGNLQFGSHNRPHRKGYLARFKQRRD